MNLSELFPFLQSLNAKPRKGLSQNFLIDGNVVRKIVRTAGVQAGDAVLEIGPGPGALTKVLLDEGARVFAIEKDTRFASALSRLQTEDQRLTVFSADALKFPLSDLPPLIKVVANLPYHITTPLLEKLFFECPFSSLTLMVQKEVATRLFANPKTSDYSSLTLFTQFYTSRIEKFVVSPSCFFPRPKVDSAVVRLDWREPPLKNPAPFFALFRRAFQQRRKMLRASLQEIVPVPQLQRALRECGISEETRPEALSLEEWLRVYQTLSQTTAEA